MAANNWGEGPQYDLVEQALQFEITPVDSLVNHDDRLGAVAPLLDWQLQESSSTLPVSPG
jgi:hypothetical protein